MCIRCLGFVLLVLFPRVLHAKTAPQHCGAPRLNGGYFVPEQETYSHETTLNYACDNGHKPVVEGWWATSTCENGKWFHEPQCIDEKACIPPTIPNAEYTESPNGWYKEGDVIRITCDEGYKHKNRDATAYCLNGTWSSVPVCERSIHACGEPPRVLHALIINQGYQEVYAGDSEVQYQCEDGYTVEGADNKKSIFCIAGNWTELPTCSRETRPGTGDGGSTVGGTGGGFTTSAGGEKQPAGGGSEHGGSSVGGTGWGHTTSAGGDEQPAGGGSEHGGSSVGGTGWGHTTSAGGEEQPAGGGSEHGGSSVGGTGWGHTTSAGGEEQPAGGDIRPGTGGSAGSSGSSRLDDRGTTSQIIPIINCGPHPTVTNGDVSEVRRMFLRYQCADYYRQVGPGSVVCYNDGTWSEVPTCEDAFCSVDTDEYPQLKPVRVKFLKFGETERLECVKLHHWWMDHYSVVRCENGALTLSRCCNKIQINLKTC